MKLSIAFLVLVFAPAWCAAQDKMSDAFRKGVAEEEAGRNPKGAIDQYKAVLVQFEEARKMAATALFRMAESYRKLGQDKEAQTAYARVLQQFPDQTQLVAESRKHVPAATASAASAGEDGVVALQRAVLVEKLTQARERLGYLQHQRDLGVISDMSQLGEATVAIKQAELDLARFEAQLKASQQQKRK
jgi:outer membrane protein assembly factor BamD (BamD/ComL family)